MKYCTKCGNEMVDDAVICTKCGCMVEQKQNNISDSSKQDQVIVKKESNDDTNGTIVLLMGILSILFTFLHIWTFVDGYGIAYSAFGVVATSLLGICIGFKGKKNGATIAGIIMSIFCAFGSVVTTIIIYLSMWY